jgi:hypothetical protein
MMPRSSLSPASHATTPRPSTASNFGQNVFRGLLYAGLFETAIGLFAWVSIFAWGRLLHR